MSIGWVQLLIILAIVLVIFGAKKLRNLGGDVGSAIKNFRQSMKEEGDDKTKPESEGGAGTKKIPDDAGKIVDGEVVSKEKDKS